jgi:hypothetical protein
MRGRSLSELTGNPAEVFLEFGYPELRWLAVVFVFLVAGFLIASIFSLARAQHGSIIVRLGAAATWLLFVLALARGGQGLWKVYQIAEKLLLDQRAGAQVASEYGYFVRSTYWILDTAGGFFILGMFAYIATHTLMLFTGRKPTTAQS